MLQWWTRAQVYTDRIVAITFYVSHLETHDSVAMHRHALRELTNETSRFNQGRNWELLTNYYVPSSWNGMPPKWQRLFFFPKGAKAWTSPAQRGQILCRTHVFYREITAWLVARTGGCDDRRSTCPHAKIAIKIRNVPIPPEALDCCCAASVARRSPERSPNLMAEHETNNRLQHDCVFLQLCRRWAERSKLELHNP